MICIPCRERDHDNCVDKPRRKAVAKGKVPAVTVINAGAWCDCEHVIPQPAPPPGDPVDC